MQLTAVSVYFDPQCVVCLAAWVTFVNAGLGASRNEITESFIAVDVLLQ